MSKVTYQFDVETTHEDRPERYKDMNYRYTIKNLSNADSDFLVKKFCQSVLRFSVDKDSPSRLNPFMPYTERFEKIGERLYEYWVVEPHTD